MRPAVPAMICAALIALAACEAPEPFADRSGVAEASAAEVSACTPLTVITTTPGISGTIGRDKALEISRNETKEKAREAGADTVVWENGGPGSEDLFVRARTYRCL
jgi:hypothetical protein